MNVIEIFVQYKVAKNAQKHLSALPKLIGVVQFGWSLH